MHPADARFAEGEGFEEVANIVRGRCSMCHAREPFWDGIHYAPKAVMLETDAEIARAAREIYLQAGITHAMPPANLTGMEPAERLAVARWYRSVAPDPFTAAMR